MAGKTRTLVLVAVFLALAVAVFWVWRSKPTQPDYDAGRAIADAFLAQVRGGQTKQAWESTTAEFKSAQGQESFAAYVKEHAQLKAPLSFVSVQTVTIADSPRAEYLYRAKDGHIVRLLAGNEQGTWRVDRVQVD